MMGQMQKLYFIGQVLIIMGIKMSQMTPILIILMLLIPIIVVTVGLWIGIKYLKKYGFGPGPIEQWKQNKKRRN